MPIYPIYNLPDRAQKPQDMSTRALASVSCISEFGVPAVNLKIACDWERIGIKMTRRYKEIVSKFGDLA